MAALKSLLSLLGKLLILSVLLLPASGWATVVRMQTSMGVIDLQLFDDSAPLTVQNFLTYVNNGAYNNSFFHRNVPGFVLQGGGYVYTNTLINIPQNAPVVNEFSASRSNVRGTIAMAKVNGNPNSATNQWFFNLADNSANLNSQNGGFTVFGQVIGQGMTIIDILAALPVYDASSYTPQYGSIFSSLPIYPLTNNVLTPANLVKISAITAGSPAITNTSDRIFAYLEATYPQYAWPAYSLAPNNGASATGSGYYYRYYSASDSYVATRDNTVYYLGPLFGHQVTPIGSVAYWLAKASAAGY